MLHISYTYRFFYKYIAPTLFIFQQSLPKCIINLFGYLYTLYIVQSKHNLTLFLYLIRNFRPRRKIVFSLMLFNRQI